MDGKGTPAITDYYTPVYVDASILMSQVLLDHLTWDQTMTNYHNNNKNIANAPIIIRGRMPHKES